MHHSHSRLLKSFFPLLIPSATYQHMRPLLRDEPVGIYSLSLWCRNSGGIFQPFYSYRFSAYAALCNFPNGCTVSVIVFAGLFNLVYYSSTLKHCQVFSHFQFPAKKQLTNSQFPIWYTWYIYLYPNWRSADPRTIHNIIFWCARSRKLSYFSVYCDKANSSQNAMHCGTGNQQTPAQCTRRFSDAHAAGNCLTFLCTVRASAELE